MEQKYHKSAMYAGESVSESTGYRNLADSFSFSELRNTLFIVVDIS